MNRNPIYGTEQAHAYESDPEHALFDQERQVWLDEVDKLGLNGKSRVLDFGAGTGALLSVLKSHGLNGVGLEPSISMIEEGLRLREQLREEDFVIGTAEDGEVLRDVTFDLIVSRQVLCHLHQPTQVFERLYAWLAQDGTLMLVDGFWPSASWRPDQLAALPLASLSNTDSVAALLHTVGFRVVFHGPFLALNAARAAAYPGSRERYLIIARK